MDKSYNHYLINNCNINLSICSYYVCATPNVYCKGTAILLENGTVVTKKPHTHEGNDINFTNNELKNQFRSVLVERAKLETKTLKTIYDEESIRYYSLNL